MQPGPVQCVIVRISNSLDNAADLPWQDRAGRAPATPSSWGVERAGSGHPGPTPPTSRPHRSPEARGIDAEMAWRWRQYLVRAAAGGPAHRQARGDSWMLCSTTGRRAKLSAPPCRNRCLCLLPRPGRRRSQPRPLAGRDERLRPPRPGNRALEKISSHPSWSASAGLRDPGPGAHTLLRRPARRGWSEDSRKSPDGSGSSPQHRDGPMKN